MSNLMGLSIFTTGTTLWSVTLAFAFLWLAGVIQ
jgi:hypothetical protein